VITPHLSDACGYLAGPDSSRLYQFNAFARDPHIRGIIALRGGYGTMRLLDGIDYDALVKDPKVLIGFSDITALLNAVSAKTGLITFHGPVAGHGHFTETVIRGLRRAVMSTKPIGQIAAANDPRERTTMYPPASGRIYGGNLSLVAALCGTPYAIPSAASILLLEEVNEAPYRVDRMLTQLRLGGYLDDVAGIALGQFVHCVPNEETDDVPSFSIAETLDDRLFGLRCPIVAEFPFGHIAAQTTIPIGARATLDAQARIMSIDETAVS
jgi:muramoyltetrapeptide carboxypeptidase